MPLRGARKTAKTTRKTTAKARATRPQPPRGNAHVKPAAVKPAAKTGKRNAARGESAGVIVGVGLSTLDMLCVAPRLDERLTELSMFSMQGGGSTGTAMATLATLGARARYFGRLADDAFGNFIMAGLRELGVDASRVDIEKDKVSPVSFIQIDELTRRRRVMFTRGSVTPPSQRDIPAGLLDGATVVCIDGYQPALQAAIAEKARTKGITVILNAGHLSGGMGELIGLSDIVIGSERFASEFAPSDDIESSLREMTRIGPRVAVITMADDGAVGLDGDKLVRQEAIDIFVADTTGAGDVFCGAFAYAVAKAWPLERALPFANAAAGLKCRSLGAQSGLPTLAEVAEAVAYR